VWLTNEVAVGGYFTDLKIWLFPVPGFSSAPALGNSRRICIFYLYLK
jgi:hypothetical protein